ncbi:MAG: formate dehydrogenase subunit gamma [Anaeromyxobacteraceae bacterium]
MTPAPQDHPLVEPTLLQRYTHRERLTHWAVATCYVVLFLSGLALFHPFFYWLTGLFGGGALMRVIHPFLGAAFAILFFAYALPLRGENRLLPSDRAWLRGMVRYMNRTGEDVPVEGKFNAGQKAMFWSMMVVIAGLLLTGLLMWRPYFAPHLAPPVRRLAGLVHAVVAFVMFVGIGIHVYAAYWTKGSIRAMTRGTVTRAWARFHHPGWYARIAGKERP